MITKHSYAVLATVLISLCILDVNCFRMGYRVQQQQHHHSQVATPSLDLISSTKVRALSSNLMERMYRQGDGYCDSKQEVLLDDFDHILDAIYIYKKTFGDLNIPIKFEIPNSSPWPIHLHGLRLGKRLEKLLSTPEFFDDYPDKVEELEKLGFTANIRSLVDDWDLIYDAMKVYKILYGDLRIPSKYIVPDTEEWPRLCRNLKLGVRVAAMRSAGRYVKDHPERKVFPSKFTYALISHYTHFELVCTYCSHGLSCRRLIWMHLDLSGGFVIIPTSNK